MQALRRAATLRGALSSSACSTSGRAIPERRAVAFSTAAAAQRQVPVVLEAEPRGNPGSASSKKLRSSGRVPAVVFSLPGEEERLVSLDAKEASRAFTRLGRLRFPCTVFEIRVSSGEDGGAPETLRALGRQAHVRATTDALENLTFLHCPEDRVVSLEVPVSFFGEDVCPGLKAGGRINRIRRTVPVRTTGALVPQGFEVDVSKLVVGDKVLLSDVPLPAGVALDIRDPTLPILKVMRK